MDEMLYIGSHVSLASPEYYLGCVKEALSYGSSTFMFYTGAPQNSFRKPLSELKIEEGRALIHSSNMDEKKIVVHAPYIINGANSVKEDIRELAAQLIRNEVERTAGFGASILVLHPGAHVGAGKEKGIECLIKTLDEALEGDESDVKIALETMAGKGSEIGVTFEEIRSIIDGCKFKSRLGVCFDTCHVSDAGYDIADVDGTLKQFDDIIGLENLLAVHVNDSKNPRGAHKDRHENIGYGAIGFDTLCKYVHHPLLRGIPKILETPYIEDKAPYKEEIEMLRSMAFKPIK